MLGAPDAEREHHLRVAAEVAAGIGAGHWLDRARARRAGTPGR